MTGNHKAFPFNKLRTLSRATARGRGSPPIFHVNSQGSNPIAHAGGLIVLPIAGIWFVARWVEIYTDERYHIAPMVGLVLSCAVIWSITARFGTVHKVSTSVISEAIIVYLVIAVAFSQVYWMMNRVFEHSFNVTVPLSLASTLLYFSLVTITTGGYGGVAPVNPYVGLVAGFEAVVGLFYIVARLVAAYRPNSA